jgi:hypothetical protein
VCGVLVQEFQREACVLDVSDSGLLRELRSVIVVGALAHGVQCDEDGCNQVKLAKDPSRAPTSRVERRERSPDRLCLLRQPFRDSRDGSVNRATSVNRAGYRTDVIVFDPPRCLPDLLIRSCVRQDMTCRLEANVVEEGVVRRRDSTTVVGRAWPTGTGVDTSEVLRLLEQLRRVDWVAHDSLESWRLPLTGGSASRFGYTSTTI